jgi:hypothetical protein
MLNPCEEAIAALWARTTSAHEIRQDIINYVDGDRAHSPSPSDSKTLCQIVPFHGTNYCHKSHSGSVQFLVSNYNGLLLLYYYIYD